MLALLVPAAAFPELLAFYFTDPVGDTTSDIDIVGLSVVFDDTTGDFMDGVRDRRHDRMVRRSELRRTATFEDRDLAGERAGVTKYGMPATRPGDGRAYARCRRSRSQSRAASQSRDTVLGVTPSVSAVCAIVRPPK